MLGLVGLCVGFVSLFPLFFFFVDDIIWLYLSIPIVDRPLLSMVNRLVDFGYDAAEAAAILLEPVMGFRVPGIGDYRYYIFMTLLTGRVGDLVGLLFQRLELAAPWLTGGGSQTRIGYAGHLGGTAFGVAYWWFWLRSRFGTW